MGLLLVILGVYLGIEMNSKFLVVGVLLGLASCAWGIRVLLRRTRRPGEVDVVSSPGSSE
jgi:hypothetical protein